MANNTKTLAIAWGTSNSMDKTKIMDASKSYANNIRNICNRWVPATACTYMGRSADYSKSMGISNRGIPSTPRAPAKARRTKNRYVEILVLKL